MWVWLHSLTDATGIDRVHTGQLAVPSRPMFNALSELANVLLVVVVVVVLVVVVWKLAAAVANGAEFHVCAVASAFPSAKSSVAVI